MIRLATNAPSSVAPRADSRPSGETRSGSPSPTSSLPVGGGQAQVTAPNKPALTVGLEPPSTVLVRWSQPNNNGAAITGYVVHRAIGTGPFSAIKETTARSFRDAVAPGRYYRYRVAAVNAAGPGAFSDVKAIVVPGTLPTAPLGLTAVMSNCHVILSWTPPESLGSGKLKGYTVIRVDSIGNTTTLTPTPITATSYDDVWNENTGVYTYRVAAVTTVGTGPAAVSKTRTLDCVPQ